LADLPEPIRELQKALSQLPGIGPRSAERMALHLVQSEPGAVHRLAECLVQARQRIRTCPTCGGLTESVPCSICANPHRDASLLCVVEQPTDIFSLEKSGSFKGKYHVLGGRLSPLDGVEADDLRIAQLETRVPAEGVKEIILALATDVEGDATSMYLARRLGPLGVKVTRLAHGLPAGSGLEYADELTLSRALEGRRELPH
jgi:recombination protein RecR